MAVRIQVILDEKELAAVKASARREGLSVSGWMREAARSRLEEAARPRFEDVAELKAFFKACDAREKGREPDWEEHLQVISRSRRPRG